MEGQYRGPVPFIRPEYKGDLSRLSRMMAWVAGVVRVIQQGRCSIWNFPKRKKFSASGSSASNSGTNVNIGGGSSPSCLSHFEKSIDRRFSRHGVPVLNLPISNPSCCKLSLKVELA